LSGYHSLV